MARFLVLNAKCYACGVATLRVNNKERVSTAGKQQRYTRIEPITGGRCLYK